MKPVYQTKYGIPHGNCFMACVASILEVPLEECPDLYDEEQQGKNWWGVSVAFVGSKGKLLDSGWDRSVHGDPPIIPSGYSIALGVARNGIGHACVALEGKIVHDPHARAAGSS
jgi:hypothetical protein